MGGKLFMRSQALFWILGQLTVNKKGLYEKRPDEYDTGRHGYPH